MKLAIVFLVSVIAWSQSSGYSPAPTQTVQPGPSGGGVSSVSANFPPSLFSVSSCNITVTSTGTFQCNYATGQTANQLLGTNSSGAVGFYPASTVLGFSPIQAGTCPETQFVTATSATSPYVICSSAAGGGGLVPPTAAGLYGIIGAQPGSTATTVFSLVPNLYSSTTGIANAATACGSTACTISPSASYTKTEQIPGFSLDPNNPGYNGYPAYGSNVTIAQDMRYGFGLYYANNQAGFNQGTINSMMPKLTTYSGGVSANGIFTSDYLMQIWYDAGGVMTSQQNDFYENKITQQPLSISLVSHNPAQHISLGILTDCYAGGDCNREDSYTYGVGGITSREDEGVHGGDNQVFEVPNEVTGTVSSSSSSSITFSSLNNLNTAGSYRNVINTTTGVISAGSILSISSPGSSLTTVTGSGTSWPVSTVVATLGTQVNTPGSATVTPTSFIAGSISNISTSSKIFVADPAGYEFVTPTSVSGSTFTAVFLYAHDSNVTFSIGGLSGFLLDPLADEVTSSTFPSAIQSVSGTLRYAWPVAYSTSSTSLMLLVAGGGTFQQMQTRFCPAASVGPNCAGSSSTAAYKLYPFTVATSVQQGGGLSYTWQKMPDPNTWNSGDSAEMLPIPARIFKAGNNIVESYYPGFENFNQGFGWTFNQPLAGNDTMIGFTNSTPWTMYLGNGGTYPTPYGMRLQGINSGIQIDEPPIGNALLRTGCPVSGTTQTCSVSGSLVEMLRSYNAVAGSGSYYHSIFSDPYNGGWFLQTEFGTNGGVDVNYNPATSTSYLGPHSGSPNTVPVNLGDSTHLWNQFWLNNSTTGCLQEASNGQVTATGSNCGSGGGLTSIPAFTALANDTNASAIPTGTNNNGLMGIIGDDQTNSVGLGSSAAFRNTIYMNHVVGVTVGSGQTTAVRTANCTAMQSAFNDAAANNWKVEIPAGVYEIYCSGGLTVTNTNSDQSLWIKGSQQSIITQFYANAQILTVGDPSGSSDYSINVNFNGIRLEYGVSQTGNTTANALVIGALRSSRLSNFFIGNDGGTYTAPNCPYANPPYRAMYLPAASSQEFSNTFEDFIIQGAQYRLLDFESLGTNSWFKNFYTTNGYAAQPGLISDSGWFLSNGQAHFVNMNLEAVAANTIINGQTLRGADFNSIHLEHIQLTGANPTIWVGGTNRVTIKAFDASGLYFTSSTLNTLTASGTGSVFSTYQDDALTIDGLNIQLQNSGNVINLPLITFNTLSVGDTTPTIEARNISADDFVSGGLLAHLSLDLNTPLANFAGFQRISDYVYHPGTSLVNGAVRPVSATYTAYGEDAQPTITVPASITSFTLTIADVLAASGAGSTAIPQVGNIVHVRRLSGTASGTLTIADAGAGSITTNTTAATDLYFKFDGSRYRLITDATSFAGSNATAIQGNPVATGTATTGQAYIANSSGVMTLTQVNTLQGGLGTSIANPSAGVQQVNVSNVPRQVTGTTDTLSSSDCNGTVIYQNTGAITVGVPTSTSTILPAGCSITLLSWKATATFNVTTSNFFSLTGTSTTGSGAFSVAAGVSKTIRVGSDNNYYQVQ